MKTTRDNLDSMFKLWQETGKRVGALDENTSYGLQYGSSSNGIQFAVMSHTEHGRQGSSGVAPFLGFTKSSAYTVLQAMYYAWQSIELRERENARLAKRSLNQRTNENKG